MDDIMFSVIIPCYNVEKYVEQCVESVLAQTYSSYEVILVDDGSTDNTSEICKKWSRNGKIRFLKKENGGLSDARNYGIRNSNGKYIVFLDGDDFIDNFALERINAEIEKTNAEVIINRFIDYFSTNKINYKDVRLKDLNTDSDLIIWNLLFSEDAWAAQKFVISKYFIESNDLSFLKGYLHEDIAWTSKLMSLSPSIAVCNYYWYFHRMQREGSITNTIKKERITHVMHITEMVLDSNYLCNSRYNKLIKERVSRSLYASLSNYKKMNNEDKQYIAKLVDEKKELFRITPEIKYALFSFVLNVLGAKKALSLIP